MKIFKSKGQLTYKSNFTEKGGNANLINVNIQSNLIESKCKKEGAFPMPDATEKINYIKAIEVQNEKLREISLIQSHKVRSPLTRIMGLIQFISDLKNSDETGTILEYILLSANELDYAIQEISSIHSHNVRSPLARIMGLIQLYDDLKNSDETGTILEYILLSANELDYAIQEISDKSIQAQA
jgi:hypothetical protein